MRFTTCLAALAALCLASVSATADDAKPADGAKNEKQAAKQAAKKASPVFRLPDSIALSEEQKVKLDALQKEYEPKLADLRAKGDVLTSEQKEALRKATEEARTSDKKGKEARAEIEARANITDEQRKAMAESKQKAAELEREIRQKISDLLTADQRKVFEETKKGPGGKPGEKPPEKKPDAVKKPNPEKTADGARKPDAIKKPDGEKKPDAVKKPEAEKKPDAK